MSFIVIRAYRAMYKRRVLSIIERLLNISVRIGVPSWMWWRYDIPFDGIEFDCISCAVFCGASTIFTYLCISTLALMGHGIAFRTVHFWLQWLLLDLSLRLLASLAKAIMLQKLLNFYFIAITIIVLFNYCIVNELWRVRLCLCVIQDTPRSSTFIIIFICTKSWTLNICTLFIINWLVKEIPFRELSTVRFLSFL